MSQDDVAQSLTALHLRMDLMELDMNLLKSREQRGKSAWDYAEEAVANEFGINVRELHTPTPKACRQKGGLPPYRHAQFVLFAILKNVMGISTYYLREHYPGITFDRRNAWNKLFALTHRPCPLGDETLMAQWQQYAPRFVGAYKHWKALMEADGVWDDRYRDEQLESLYSIQ